MYENRTRSFSASSKKKALKEKTIVMRTILRKLAELTKAGLLDIKTTDILYQRRLFLILDTSRRDFLNSRSSM